MKMKIHYFEGPTTDMSDLIEGTHTCSFCEKESAMCFEIDNAITSKYEDEDRIGKLGCVNCLKKGEFGFWHDTEYGMLSENGFLHFYEHNMKNPPKLEASKMEELLKTPQIITWQQELWLTHCNDFMVYKGTWNPLDFKKNSSSNNGKELFLEMTDKELNHIWDESLQKGETELKEWGITYYAFECKHCGKLRGNWDCD